ncbi:sigma-70 family RNA polymerase sigma factor [Sandaracinus amylolyticus]|uniref:sigma-70 family RNA polymerase sigma factor n=1 Tax=Sandaracinus amylolyticus TaxID=927083 RepID=UPI001F015197|nr:sigma-70 family RNA polymerase sigma factor [Sandaracinus amylolyticus]UJR80972.1 RNA polymerase subunit sigma [Sandaracinus amylolyticus]
MDPRVRDALERERTTIWGVCYRMTGSASAADDLTQDTLIRALERPPADLDAPLRPWLVRVAVNLARDALRRRKREAYTGPWLPEPALTDASVDEVERREIASYALLVAMEQLTPHQRAVLVLRDVLDLGEAETAEALESTVGSVKVALHRARKTIADHAPAHTLSRESRAQNGFALAALLEALSRGDVEATRRLLAEDVRLVQDSAGRVRAAVTPVVGIEKVLTFLTNVAKITPQPIEVRWIEINHTPALDSRLPPRPPPLANRLVMWTELDAEGRIAALHNLLAPEKLERLDARMRP